MLFGLLMNVEFFNYRYTSLVELAEYIFPPYKTAPSRTEVRHELAPRFSFSTMDGYGDFEFWRTPIADLPQDAQVPLLPKGDKKLARSQSAMV